MDHEYEVVTEWPTGNCPACGGKLELVDVYSDRQRSQLLRNYWSCSLCDWRELNHVARQWLRSGPKRF